MAFVVIANNEETNFHKNNKTFAGGKLSKTWRALQRVCNIESVTHVFNRGQIEVN